MGEKISGGIVFRSVAGVENRNHFDASLLGLCWALEGNLQAVYVAGKVVGHVRKYDTRLQIEFLRPQSSATSTNYQLYETSSNANPRARRRASAQRHHPRRGPHSGRDQSDRRGRVHLRSADCDEL